MQVEYFRNRIFHDQTHQNYCGSLENKISDYKTNV